MHADGQSHRPALEKLKRQGRYTDPDRHDFSTESPSAPGSHTYTGDQQQRYSQSNTGLDNTSLRTRGHASLHFPTLNESSARNHCESLTGPDLEQPRSNTDRPPFSSAKKSASANAIASTPWPRNSYPTTPEDAEKLTRTPPWQDARTHMRVPLGPHNRLGPLPSAQLGAPTTQLRSGQNSALHSHWACPFGRHLELARQHTFSHFTAFGLHNAFSSSIA